jgi:hypothetical protein
MWVDASVKSGTQRALYAKGAIIVSVVEEVWEENEKEEPCALPRSF